MADKKGKRWAIDINKRLSQQITHIKLIARILFLNAFYLKNADDDAANGSQNNNSNYFLTRGHKNLKFLFIEYGKISTIGGETALALMIATLYSKLEMHFGIVITRLCRVFFSKQNTHTHSKFRLFCFIPTFVLVILVLLFSLALLIFVRIRGIDFATLSQQERAFVFTVVLLILITVLGSSITWYDLLSFKA